MHSDSSAPSSLIFAPGSRAEPPFEVSLVDSHFSYAGNRDTSIFLIKIGSLYSSWVVVKRTEDVLSLLRDAQRRGYLGKVDLRIFTSLCPAKILERGRMACLVISSLLNNRSTQRIAQGFTLTNAYNSSLTGITSSLDVVLSILGMAPQEGKEDMAVLSLRGAGHYYIERRGVFGRWVPGFYQIQRGALIRTSVRTGRVKEFIALSGKNIYKSNSDSLHSLVIEDREGKRILYSTDTTTHPRPAHPTATSLSPA